jgi:CubicO group peptidase (beta-lactamase class C family)
MRGMKLCLSAVLLLVSITGGRSIAVSAETALPAITPVSPSEVGFSAEKLEALEAYVEDQIKSDVVPGVVVYLARHGKPVLAKAYGARSFGGEKMTIDTIFRAYSMTKPVTGLAMAMLYEEGKWQLDDPITKFLPELADLKVFRELGPDGQPVFEPLQRPATMRELMTHSAGFIYGFAPTDYVSKAYIDAKLFTRPNLEDFLKAIAGLPLAGQPGSKWRYSFSTDLQGIVVERLSGQTLDVFFKARIFDPLGMTDTGFFVPGESAQRFAAVYSIDRDSGKLIDSSKPAGDYSKPPTLRSGGGGLVTTAPDYAKFAQALLNGGELNGVRIAKAETVKLMGTNLLPENQWITRENGAMAQGTGYGMNVAVITDPAPLKSPQGVGTISWGGAASTHFWVDPANDFIFVWMVQRFGSSVEFREKTIKLVYDALEGPKR